MQNKTANLNLEQKVAQSKPQSPTFALRASAVFHGFGSKKSVIICVNPWQRFLDLELLG
jgi:hypothetical protein